MGSPLSAAQLSHEPYGLAHCLVETRKSLTIAVSVVILDRLILDYDLRSLWVIFDL